MYNPCIFSPCEAIGSSQLPQEKSLGTYEFHGSFRIILCNNYAINCAHLRSCIVMETCRHVHRAIDPMCVQDTLCIFVL